MVRCTRNSGHSATTLRNRDVIHSDVQIFTVFLQYPNFIWQFKNSADKSSCLSIGAFTVGTDGSQLNMLVYIKRATVSLS